MLVSDFDFELPAELIAQQPPEVRGASRMLYMHRAGRTFEDRLFVDLPDLLQPGDLLVLNDSRVLPARLFATRGGLATQHNSPPPSGVVEVLLTSPAVSLDGHNDWHALVKPAKKVLPGESLLFRDAQHEVMLKASVMAEGDFGERTLRFDAVDDFHARLERIGHLPLPPYIHRDKAAPNTPEDRARYQTVYSRESGSAAAPTAGLHFTPEILDRLAERGVEIARITLHVGLGTFQPVRVVRTEEIRLHAEPYTLSAEAAAAVNAAWREGRRIIAVGTTTTRTLEHLARQFIGEQGPLSQESPLSLKAHVGSTSLFLSPDGDSTFHLVAGLLTNFHLPQSTLLMLVSAFNGADGGRENMLQAYAHAIRQHYRFFSYGDCMLIL